MLETRVKIVVGIIAGVLCVGFGFVAGKRWESAKHADEVVKLAEANTEKMNQAFQRYRATLEAQRQKDKEVIGNYEKELNSITHNRSSERLFIPASVCNRDTVPPRESAAVGIDEVTTATVALPEQTSRNLRELAEEADRVSAQLRALQESVR